MNTLSELKTKYQEEQDAQARAYAAKEAEKDRQRQAIVGARFFDVCSYLAQREDVGIDQFVEYGRLKGDWYDDKLESLMFYLELPEHYPAEIRLGYVEDLNDNANARWYVDDRGFDQLAAALIYAANGYQAEKESNRRWAEQEAAEAASYQQYQAKIEKEADERRQLFDQIADNPTAILLLRLFVQITKDTQALDSQMADH